MSDELEGDDAVVGRGASSLKGALHQIEAKTNAVVTDAIMQVGNGCLSETPTTDSTAHISKKDTVFYVDTDALAQSGNETAAKNIEQQQDSLLASRREANKRFDHALANVSESAQTDALKAMNYIKEQIYYQTYNDYHQLAANSPNATKNTLAEVRVSQAKLLLAEQLEDGSFAKRVQRVEDSGAKVVCEGNEIVR